MCYHQLLELFYPVDDENYPLIFRILIPLKLQVGAGVTVLLTGHAVSKRFCYIRYESKSYSLLSANDTLVRSSVYSQLCVQANPGIAYLLDVDGEEKEVVTKFFFTKEIIYFIIYFLSP